MKNLRESSKTESTAFRDEYEEIVNSKEKIVVVNQEWSEKGDVFQKFSMYENYTPVKTSGSTTLISQL